MTEITHTDRLGKAIALNDFVAYPSRNELEIGKIIKITKKMVRVAPVDASGRYQTVGQLKYPCDTVWLEPSKLTFYLIRNAR